MTGFEDVIKAEVEIDPRGEMRFEIYTFALFDVRFHSHYSICSRNMR